MAIFAQDMTKAQMLGEAERLEELAEKWRADAASVLSVRAPTRELRQVNKDRAKELEGHAAKAEADAAQYRELAASQFPAG